MRRFEVPKKVESKLFRNAILSQISAWDSTKERWRWRFKTILVRRDRLAADSPPSGRLWNLESGIWNRIPPCGVSVESGICNLKSDSPLRGVCGIWNLQSEIGFPLRGRWAGGWGECGEGQGGAAWQRDILSASPQ
jgi:hypothetical protein